MLPLHLSSWLFIFAALLSAILLYCRRSSITVSAGATRGRVETAHPYGAAESVGRRAYMEDRHVVTPLASTNVEVPRRGGGGGGGGGAVPAALYALFDGHAGFRAAEFCASVVAAAVSNDRAWPESPGSALSNAFLALDRAFLDMARVARPPYDDGTTALAAVSVGPRFFIANAGDSRALLVRAGGEAPLPLSDDHKADRPDEVARIRALGGSVFFHGVWRVGGVLAVSRSIGDRSLKPFVTAQPDIAVHDVVAGDDALVLATDGLWDVLSNEAVANTVAATFFSEAASEENGGKKAAQNAAAQRAASTLVRDAILGGSADNVTVIVVDLRRLARESGGGALAPQSPVVRGLAGALCPNLSAINHAVPNAGMRRRHDIESDAGERSPSEAEAAGEAATTPKVE